MKQTFDEPVTTEVNQTNYRQCFNLRQFNIPIKQEHHAISWLDLTKPEEKNFAEVFGEKVVSSKDSHLCYYGISETAMNEVIKASQDVHQMFLKATEQVLKNDSLLEIFDIPKELWQKIRKSWRQSYNPKNIHGRIDFSVSDRGIKVYEYNADSSSLLYQCAFSQGKWCRAVGICSGKDAGAQTEKILTKVWSEVGDDLIFILRDSRDQQYYHDLLMKKIIQGAGKRAKIITNLQDFCMSGDGTIVDKDGDQVKTVWKSWNWETILKEYKQDLQQKRLKDENKKNLKLHDIVLNQKVNVYEPLWTVITTNKAILPIIYQMFPQNEHILQASYELTSDLKSKGYVKKPVRGRCGLNMQIVNGEGKLMEKNQGQFNLQKCVYQQLFLLPIIGTRAVQINTFMVNGAYAGTVLRTDPSLIINYESLTFALRVIPDKDLEPQNKT